MESDRRPASLAPAAAAAAATEASEGRARETGPAAASGGPVAAVPRSRREEKMSVTYISTTSASEVPGASGGIGGEGGGLEGGGDGGWTKRGPQSVQSVP